MSKIVDYEDKVDLIDSPEIPDNQKIKATEMNNIRDAVNQVYERIINLEVNGMPGGDTLPVGTMVHYTGDYIAEGWLLCNGAEINRDDYADLFAIIGTSYGEGNGTTTFNLPNEPAPITYSAPSSGVIQFEEHNPELKVIIKAKQIVPVVAQVENELNSDSTVNPPSVLAVNEGLKKSVIRPDGKTFEESFINIEESVKGKQDIFPKGDYSGDLDKCTEIGCFWCNFTKTTNAPLKSGFGWLECTGASRGIVSLQKMFAFSSNGIENIYIRCNANGQWHPWRKTATVAL